eukprot:3611346-Pleurochrysis_carterae.AAC.1
MDQTRSRRALQQRWLPLLSFLGKARKERRLPKGDLNSKLGQRGASEGRNDGMGVMLGGEWGFKLQRVEELDGRCSDALAFGIHTCAVVFTRALSLTPPRARTLKRPHGQSLTPSRTRLARPCRWAVSRTCASCFAARRRCSSALAPRPTRWQSPRSSLPTSSPWTTPTPPTPTATSDAALQRWGRLGVFHSSFSLSLPSSSPTPTSLSPLGLSLLPSRLALRPCPSPCFP